MARVKESEGGVYKKTEYYSIFSDFGRLLFVIYVVIS